MLNAKTYKTNEVIFRTGDPAEQMYFITSGAVRVEALDAKYDLKEGDYFGELALLERRDHISSVIAQSQLHVLELDKNDFKYLLSIHPEINDKIRQVANNRLKESADAMTLDNHHI